ncbi:MAG: hypothetical protein K2R98_02045 [Gemmataceae bacterium]|nr:hypothetical protein [Gemmataceae bacterium]
MYLQVKFGFDRAVVPVLIPSAALAARSGATRIVVLDGGQRIQYRDAKLGRDFGAEIEVVAGIKPSERVVVRPGDGLRSND